SVDHVGVNKYDKYCTCLGSNVIGKTNPHRIKKGYSKQFIRSLEFLDSVKMSEHISEIIIKVIIVAI
ncbi:hypothetical protein BSK56_33500, partial [Paenibacillus borealis]